MWCCSGIQPLRTSTFSTKVTLNPTYLDTLDSDLALYMAESRDHVHTLGLKEGIVSIL